MFLQCKSGSHIGGKHLVRTLISSGEAFAVIFYKYAKYSNVSWKLHISTTKCKGVFLDVCKQTEMFHKNNFKWRNHVNFRHNLHKPSNECLALQLSGMEGNKEFCHGRVIIITAMNVVCTHLSLTYFTSSGFRTLGVYGGFAEKISMFHEVFLTIDSKNM